jgi:PAS domain S-box-containing protein
MMEALPPVLISRLLEDAFDAVVIIDDRCRIRYLNGSMSALAGYGREELLGKPLDGLLPGALGAHHGNYVASYIDGGKPSGVLARVREFTIRHRSGEMIRIELKALDLGLLDGARYFGAFMLDLRARREVELKNAALLEQQALTDALTGLPNRRAFESEGVQMMARGGELAVGVADVDHFKKINDTYGHAVGDAVLCAVAGTIRDVGRATDMVARLGGEEFGMLFANTTLAPDGRLDEALRDADKALYGAKQRGRNRVRIAPRPGIEPQQPEIAVL